MVGVLTETSVTPTDLETGEIDDLKIMHFATGLVNEGEGCAHNCLDCVAQTGSFETTNQ